MLGESASPPQTAQRALTRARGVACRREAWPRGSCQLLSVVAPVFNEEGTCARSASGRSPRWPACRSSSSSSTTARATGRRRSSTSSRPSDPRVRVVTLSRNFGHQTALTAGLEHAAGDAVVMIDARPPGPARADPRAGRAVARGVGRRVRRARAARGRDALQADDRALVLPPARPRGPDRGRAERGRLPAARPARARRAARDARAQPLPARHDRVGRLHPDRRALPARRRATPARRSSRCARCCASRSTRSRRSRTCRCSSRRCSASSSRRSRSSASRSRSGSGSRASSCPASPRSLIAVLLLGGMQLIGDRDHRRVPGAHLRRGQAAAAVLVGAAQLEGDSATRRRARSAGDGPHEGRGDRGRRRRPRRRAPAGPGRARVRRLRALAGAGRPGGDARRRRRVTARALLPPPVHERPPHRRRSTTSSGCRTSWSGAPRRGVLRRERQPGRSRRRSTCCASGRCRCRAPAHGPRRRAAPAPAPRRRAVRGRDRARMGACATMGGRRGTKVWGPLLRGKFGDRAPTTSRWPGCGASSPCAARSRARRRAQELLGYPRGSFETLFARLPQLIEPARRPGAHRPPRAPPGPQRAAGSSVDAGRAGLVPRRARPAPLRDGRASPSATTP